MNKGNFLGMTELSQDMLSVALVIFVTCLGIRIVRSPETALKVANVQLVTSSSANRLEQLAEKLEEQARVIEQKDIAYQELQTAYQEYLQNRKGDIELGQKIEAIDKLPKVEDISNIKTEIKETEEDLLKISDE